VVTNIQRPVKQPAPMRAAAVKTTEVRAEIKSAAKIIKPIVKKTAEHISPPVKPDSLQTTTIILNNNKLSITDDSKPRAKEIYPLIIYDGQEISGMEKIKSIEISKIDVLKGEKATKEYGIKGKNGVIIISSKSAMLQSEAQEANSN
jgi:hypothetical protein